MASCAESSEAAEDAAEAPVEISDAEEDEGALEEEEEGFVEESFLEEPEGDDDKKN